MTRQSPSSSRKRSTTSVVSVGTWPVDSLLLVDEGDEVVRGALVEPAVGEVAAGCAESRAPRERADRPAELGRAAEAVALPERARAGDAEGGGDEHAVVGDVLDAPARRAEREDVADARLVDHLLVELADALPPLRRSSPTMNTPNSPRSGIVPPLVTASRCAPGRPVIVPATRSHTMRGRSSANSSLG